MPIAIYRLKKLSVAMPRDLRQTVFNHSRRQLVDLAMSHNQEGPVIRVFFTEIERRKGLVIHHDEEWEFTQAGFHSIKRKLRNGRMVTGSRQFIPPAYAQSWTQAPVESWLWDRFEDEQTSLCIMEQYLHGQVANPHDYRIITFDFNVDGPALYMTHKVRPIEEVLDAAANDRSEDVEAWSKLFLR